MEPRRPFSPAGREEAKLREMRKDVRVAVAGEGRDTRSQRLRAEAVRHALLSLGQTGITEFQGGPNSSLDWFIRSEPVSCGCTALLRRAAVGASRPLPSVPTKVSLLNRLPTLDLRGRDYSSCPKGAFGPGVENLSSGQVSSHSIERRVCCLTTEPLPKQVGDIELSSTIRMLTLMTPTLRLSRRRCAAVEQ